MFKKKEEKSKKINQLQNQDEKHCKYEEGGEISISHDSNMIDQQQNQHNSKNNRVNAINRQEDLMGSQYNHYQQQDKLSQINSKIQNQSDVQTHKVNFAGINEKISSKIGSKSVYSKKNLLDMINSQQNMQQIQYKFQAPYQLALIYITWIYFGFCFIMRNEFDGVSNSNQQSNLSSSSISESDEDFEQRKLFAISGLLMVMGIIGIVSWQFVIMKKKVRLSEITNIQRLLLMGFFFFSQILVMEAFVLKQNIADSWVITATIVQMSYIQSISRVNLFNLIYIGVSTIYLIIRFQFIVDWEWQSLLYSILVCTVIVFHQEKLQVEKQKQTKKMLSTNQKAHRLNNFYYDILGMIPEGVAIFDKNQTTIFCNKTIKDIFKCKKDQLNKILLGLSTNQQHNPSPQPSPNNNNNQFNSSNHNLQNQSQQYFKSTTSNQQKEQQQQQQANYLNQQQSIKAQFNNTNGNVANNSNFNENMNSNILYQQDNIKDDISLSLQQSNVQSPIYASGSNRMIQFRNENQLKNINTSSIQRQSNDLNENFNILTENDKKTQKTKTLDQQKSIFTPSFKGPDSLFNNVEIPQNPTFSKIQTKELASPLESKGGGIALSKTNSKEEQQQQSPIYLKYKNSSSQQNASNYSPQKSNLIVNSNHIYNNPLNSVTNDNYNFVQEPLHSPVHNTYQQGFFIDSKGIVSGGADLGKSIRGIDSNSNNEPMIQDGNSILSNNQLINHPPSQISPRKQQSLHKKLTHPIINASSQRNEDEEESDIDIFNNFIYQQEGQKIFKKKLFNQKKGNDIIQGETKVGDILTDLFGEIAGSRINNSQGNYNSAGPQINNNLDPSMQSPNNHNGFNFVGQSANNMNKEIPLTPSSIKKPEFGKSKTFFSQMNKNTNLGYMQFQEDMIKVQVRWKDQIFVLKFLLFELETSENNSEIFILVLVDPLWQEYYNKRMEEVQKYKMKMFASLSHELRTPLNCTISMLEGLEQFITDPGLIDDYLYPALHSQKLLLNQINDILDFAQIDSGKFKYTNVDFNLERLLQDCQTLIQMQANVKSLDLQLIYDSRLNLMAKSDPNRIRQILLNFLSNSLKFTPEYGTIKIIAEPMFVNETNKTQKYIRLAVQDTGLGMKPETLQNIFNAFNKTEYENEGMNSQGCGLGLAISQSISKGLCSQNFHSNSFNPSSDYQIAQHLVGVQVESVYQQGSTFSFIIQDMNPKPLLNPQYSHNNSYTHSVLPLDMINEEDLANSYISVKNDHNDNNENSNQNTLRQANIHNDDIISKIPKEDKDISLFGDSACIQEGSIDQNKSPQFMEVGNFFDVNYRLNNEIASVGQNSPLQKPAYPQGNTPTSIYGPLSYSPHSQNKASDNQQQNQSQQSSSTSTFQSVNKFNQSTQNSINAQLYNNNNNQSQKIIQTSSINNQITVIIETEELNRNNLPQLNEGLRNSQTPTSQLKNNLLTENGQRFSTSNSISNLYSNSSKVIPSSSKLTSNLSRTLTNKSLSKMNSAQGFNGYHSKSNLNEMEGAKLMINLQQFIENSSCENKCASILIVDDNQFNIIALSRILQQFFNVPVDKAFDGKQAYEKICAKYTTNKQHCSRCTKYEIIFMDIEMPILNGYEVIREVIDFFNENKIDKSEYPYIIACTAHGGDQEQVKAKMSGFDDYISKPIMRADLQKLLCDWYYYAHFQHHGQKNMNKQGSLLGLNSLPSDK